MVGWGMSEVELLGVRVPAELKGLVDADPRTNQEVVRSALWREFGGERVGPLERRIEEKQRRISMIESERKERERELREKREELESLQEKLDGMESEEARKERQIQETVAKLSDVPVNQLTPDTPPVSSNAQDLGIEPEELLDRIMEVKNE